MRAAVQPKARQSARPPTPNTHHRRRPCCPREGETNDGRLSAGHAAGLSLRRLWGGRGGRGGRLSAREENDEWLASQQPDAYRRTRRPPDVTLRKPYDGSPAPSLEAGQGYVGLCWGRSMLGVEGGRREGWMMDGKEGRENGSCVLCSHKRTVPQAVIRSCAAGAPSQRNVLLRSMQLPYEVPPSFALSLPTFCAHAARLTRGPPLALGPAFARLHNRSFERRLERLPLPP